MLAQWIAIVEPSQSWATLSSVDRARVLATSGLTGLDVRLGRPGTEACVLDCVRAGRPYRLHSWVGRHDGTRATVDTLEARRQARAVADEIGRVALIAGHVPASYAANAERDWWDHNGAAVDALDAFADAFHGRTQTPLDYLGFAVPSWHYGRADWDRDGDVDTTIPEASRARWRRLLCMAYQTREADLVATLERARAAWPTHPLGAFVGIGAMDRDGSIVGDPKAIQHVAAQRVAGLDELTHYVGLGASRARMVCAGNERVRPLIARIPEIAQACVGETHGPE